MSTYFTSAEEAEAAFYEAIVRGDLDALMAVWADDEEVVCIHPTGQRLTGNAAIRDSWRNIFASNARLRVALSGVVRWNSTLMAVHSVVETLYVGEDPTPHGPMLATNIFQRGAGGWRLISHHASAAAEPPAGENAAPRVLH